MVVEGEKTYLNDQLRWTELVENAQDYIVKGDGAKHRPTSSTNSTSASL